MPRRTRLLVDGQSVPVNAHSLKRSSGGQMHATGLAERGEVFVEGWASPWRFDLVIWIYQPTHNLPSRPPSTFDSWAHPLLVHTRLKPFLRERKHLSVYHSFSQSHTALRSQLQLDPQSSPFLLLLAFPSRRRKNRQESRCQQSPPKCFEWRFRDFCSSVFLLVKTNGRL